MSRHKTTMRDIARECDVSVATVSYVLNHSEKERISHETRLKIMETATRLHYELHVSGEPRLKNQSRLVAIIVNLKVENCSSKKLMFYDLASELSNQLKLSGFQTILINSKNLSEDVSFTTRHHPDALFIIDADDTVTEQFTKDYYIPILFLDCENNNPLFCKIHPDYSDLVNQAKHMLHDEYPFLILEDICNIPIRNQFLDWFLPTDIFINTPGSDLTCFLRNHKDQTGIVIGDILGMQVEQYFRSDSLVIISSLGNTSLIRSDIKKLYVRNKEKAIIASNILNEMLLLDYSAENENRILLKASLK